MNYCPNAVIFFQYLRGRFFRAQSKKQGRELPSISKAGKTEYILKPAPIFEEKNSVMKNELAVPARIEHIPPMSVTFLERRENRTTGPNAAQSPEIENARILKEFEPISAESANERREKIRTLKNLTYPISFLSTSERINGYISSAKNPDAIRIFAFVTAERTPKTATRRRQRTKERIRQQQRLHHRIGGTFLRKKYQPHKADESCAEKRYCAPKCGDRFCAGSDSRSFHS